MIISGINMTQTTSTGFTQSGAAKRTPEKTDTVETGKAQGVTLSNSNMMTGHFVHGAKEDSKYISGLMKGLEAKNSSSSQLNNMVTDTDIGGQAAPAQTLPVNVGEPSRAPLDILV